MSTTEHTAPSKRTRIRRLPNLADYQRSTLHAIIDAAYLCHIAFHDESGLHCIPTACWRTGEYLYIHGSNGSRLLKLLSGSTQACVSITHLDGLVLARSAFSHTMNYRSAVIYGHFELISDIVGKHEAMDAFMDRLMQGRKLEARPGNEKEFAATTVMRISLDEAAAKVHSGGVSDDAEDMDIQVWAGVLPLVQTPMPAIPDPGMNIPAPDYVKNWSNGSNGSK